MFSKLFRYFSPSKGSIPTSKTDKKRYRRSRAAIGDPPQTLDLNTRSRRTAATDPGVIGYQSLPPTSTKRHSLPSPASPPPTKAARLDTEDKDLRLTGQHLRTAKDHTSTPSRSSYFEPQLDEPTTSSPPRLGGSGGLVTELGIHTYDLHSGSEGYPPTHQHRTTTRTPHTLSGPGDQRTAAPSTYLPTWGTAPTESNIHPINTEDKISESTIGKEPIRTNPTQAPTTKCFVCYGYFTEKDMLQANCESHHKFCKGCLEGLFVLATKDESVWPASCCHVAFLGTMEFMKTFLTDEQAGGYAEKSMELSTKPINRVYCSQLACGNYLGTNSGKEGAVRCSCGVRTCWSCKSEGHSGGCKVDALDALLVETAKKEGWKQCGGCGRMLERLGGCNHITCRCNYNFCYLCGKEWGICECDDFEDLDIIVQTRAINTTTQLPPEREGVPLQAQGWLEDAQPNNSLTAVHGGGEQPPTQLPLPPTLQAPTAVPTSSASANGDAPYQPPPPPPPQPYRHPHQQVAHNYSGAAQQGQSTRNTPNHSSQLPPHTPNMPRAMARNQHLAAHQQVERNEDMEPPSPTSDSWRRTSREVPTRRDPSPPVRPRRNYDTSPASLRAHTADSWRSTPPTAPARRGSNPPTRSRGNYYTHPHPPHPPTLPADGWQSTSTRNDPTPSARSRRNYDAPSRPSHAPRNSWRPTGPAGWSSSPPVRSQRGYNTPSHFVHAPPPRGNWRSTEMSIFTGRSNGPPTGPRAGYGVSEPQGGGQGALSPCASGHEWERLPSTGFCDVCRGYMVIFLLRCEDCGMNACMTCSDELDRVSGVSL